MSDINKQIRNHQDARLIKVKKDIDDWITKLANQCALNENKRLIPKHEILRRISNIPNINDTILKDSILYKRKK